MSKYTLLVVCALCTFAMGYMGLNLIQKDVALPTPTSSTTPTQPTTSDQEVALPVNNTENFIIKSETGVFSVIPKQKETVPVTQDDAVLTVSNSQLLANLNNCTPSKNVDMDYGIYPHDGISQDLTQLEWGIEITGDKKSNCTIVFSAAFYDSLRVKHLEDSIQCTYDFSNATEEEILKIYKDGGTAASIKLMSILSISNREGLSDYEKLHYPEASASADLRDEPTDLFTIDAENTARIKCSDLVIVTEN